jgi:peptide/nickel transport system substrate-binding protein
MGNCYQRLLRSDTDDPTRLVPDLARRWTLSADGRTYAFELEPGLRFASGNPLGAEDVVYSLQRAVRLDKAPAFILTQFGLTAANVEARVRQTGPLALTLQTDRAYAPSLVCNCLTANVAAVVDRRLVQAHETGGDLGNTWLRTRCAGSGPLKIRQWRANELVLLERNEFHRGTPARLARVAYRHVKESAIQRLLLVKGDVDIARDLTPQDLDALAGRVDIRTTATAKGAVTYFSLNQKNPILARPEVREAFKWLVDYEAIGRTLIRHIGVVHQNFLPLGLLGASSEQPYRLDVARARALLAHAGLAGGFKVTIDMRSAQPVQGITEALQQSFGLAGIELLILPGDGKQTLTRYRARRHDLYIGNWAVDYWDPHSNADTFARNPDNGDGARSRPLAWRNAWDIPELTRLSDAAAQERDSARRAGLYQAIQAEFRRTSPFVMLYQQTEVAALRADVDGLRLGPTSDTTYLFKVGKA